MRVNVIVACWPADSALAGAVPTLPAHLVEILQFATRWNGASFSADFDLKEELDVETHGPLGTLWVGLGLGAYFLALTWMNILLGHMLTPLFLIPITWLQEALQQRKRKAK